MELLTPAKYTIILYVVILAILLTASLTLFIRYFYSSVKAAGIERVSRFTLFILTAGLILTLVNVLPSPLQEFHFIAALPVREDILDGSSLKFLPFLFFLVFSALLYNSRRTGTNTNVLRAVWIIMLCFNIGDVLLNLYFYFSWIKPESMMHYEAITESIIIGHVRNSGRERYLLYLLYPTLWTIVCGIAVAKTFNCKDKNKM